MFSSMWQVKDMVEFSDAVRAKGGRFVEAPVSGSKVPAETVRRPSNSIFKHTREATISHNPGILTLTATQTEHADLLFFLSNP